MQAHETSLFKITTPEVLRLPFALIVAMLTNSVGSFRNLAPQARVDDGKIWLGIFKDFNYLDLIKVIPEFLSGQPLTSELMTLKALEEVRIELLSDHPLFDQYGRRFWPVFPPRY